ncbi:MAG: PGF-pre-PGF domain-containing protein, partial [Candidatus Micrarchaeota archaeon]
GTYPDGQYNLTANITDWAGNTKSLTNKTFVIDSTVPLGHMNNESGSYTSLLVSGNLNVTVFANESQNTSWWVDIGSATNYTTSVYNISACLTNTTTYACQSTVAYLYNYTSASAVKYNRTVANWTAMIDTTSVTDGKYNITINITDWAGNTAVRSNVSVTVNNTDLTYSGQAPTTLQTTSAPVLKVTTSEVANCYYNTTSGFTWSTGGTAFTNGQGTTAHNTTLSVGYGTSYTYYIVCVDMGNSTGITAETSANFTTYSSGAGTGGSGGSSGSGGGTTANTQTSSVSGTTAAGGEVAFTFTKEVVAVQSVEVTAASAVTSPSIKVESLGTTAPSTVSSGAQGTVYKYLTFTPTNLADAAVDTATIKFKVEKTWFTTNSLDAATTKLGRYENSAWNYYDTTQYKDADATYYYFESEVPGFSDFAITAGVEEGCTQTCETGYYLDEELCTCRPVSECDLICGTDYTLDANTCTCTCTKTCDAGYELNSATCTCVEITTGGTAAAQDYTMYIIIAVVVIVIIGGVFFMKGKK